MLLTMPRLASALEALTFEEYLVLEEKLEMRHEFVDGYLFEMPGTTKVHNLIIGNIFASARAAVRQKQNCAMYTEVIKLRTPNGTGYYPDLVIACDDDPHQYVVRHPCLIVEVLSDSTEDIDRGEKWRNYQKFPSLQMYLLVSQKRRFVEVYKRNPDGTWLYYTLEDEGSLEFSCADFTMTLEDVYLDVPTPEADPVPPQNSGG
jgi:Uma2 family endonuclease